LRFAVRQPGRGAAAREPRGSGRGLPRSGNPRLHRGPAARLPDAGRRERCRPVRRAEAAHRHCPRTAAPAADPDLRRSYRQPGSRHRGGVRAHGEPAARQRDSIVHRASHSGRAGRGQHRQDRTARCRPRAPRPAAAEVGRMNLPVRTESAAGALARRSEFLPAILQLQEEAPSPMPRLILWVVITLVGALVVWSSVGKLDVVAVAEGRLVPKSQLRIVQPAEGGVMRELLVREGERVRAGQVLARMDVRAAEADAATAQNEIAIRRLQLRRIDAELGGPLLAILPEDPPRLFQQVEAQRHARVQAQEAALAEQRTVIARARREMQAATETQTKLAGALPVLAEQERAFEQLARDGYAGRLMVAQRSRERLDAEQDLRAQEHRVEGARAAIEQGERRITQLVASYRAQLQRLLQELEKLSHRRRLAKLRAPADGVVKDLATQTTGAVLAPGTVLMT